MDGAAGWLQFHRSSLADRATWLRWGTNSLDSTLAERGAAMDWLLEFSIDAQWTRAAVCFCPKMPPDCSPTAERPGPSDRGREAVSSLALLEAVCGSSSTSCAWPLPSALWPLGGTRGHRRTRGHLMADIVLVTRAQIAAVRRQIGCSRLTSPREGRPPWPAVPDGHRLGGRWGDNLASAGRHKRGNPSIRHNHSRSLGCCFLPHRPEPTTCDILRNGVSPRIEAGGTQEL